MKSAIDDDKISYSMLSYALKQLMNTIPEIVVDKVDYQKVMAMLAEAMKSLSFGQTVSPISQVSVKPNVIAY